MTPAHRRTLSAGLLLAALLAALGTVGSMDYDDQRAAERHACDMIDAGHWPPQVAPHCSQDKPQQ